MKDAMRYLSSFVAPVVVCFVLPYLIVVSERRASGRPLINPATGLAILGFVVFAGGLAAAVVTMRTFILIGKGTIMPWDPTRKLVIAGPYRYVRNPMISSILIVLLGEALLFASPGIALLAGLFFVINTIYFIYSEEPGLARRFGAEYKEYKQHVGRWIPRGRPWEPD